MIKKSSKLVMASLAIGFLGLTFQNCSKADFGLTEEGQLNAQGIYIYDTAFAPTTRSQVPVDLIWIIDNSGSMGNEAAHVRSNFQSFASKLEASTDFRLALISKQGTTGTAVSLPYSGSRYKQVNQTVASRNAFDIASAAIASGGSLDGFLRADSKKIFIVVTDDESTMSAATFKANFSAVYPASQLAVFAFASKAAVTGCSVSRVGAVYAQIAAQTGGSVYEVCNTDWSGTFSHLSDSVIAISKNTIKLPETERPIIGIVEVQLNGVVLAEADYNFDGTSIISIQPSRLSGLDMANVRILYQIEMPETARVAKIAAVSSHSQREIQ